MHTEQDCLTPAPSLIDRYESIHRTGLDCRVTCSRNILDFFGHRYSYSDIQGFASSLFFTYRTDYTTRDVLLHPEVGVCDYFWPISGHRVELLENLAYVFNATLVTGHPLTPVDALEEILPFLNEGIPVMVAVSREALQRYYTNFEYNYPDFMAGLDFAGHWVIVVGVDKQRDTATLFETNLKQKIEVPLGILAQARTLGDDQANFYMKSKNRWAVFMPPASPPTLEHMMSVALGRVAFNYRIASANQDAHTGLPGLKKFCRELPHWCERADLSLPRLRATLFMMRMTSDMLAGAGLGRRNFGIFLRHAERVMRNSRVGEAASCFGTSHELWQALMTCVEAELADSSRPATFDKSNVRKILEQILDIEQEGLFLLESAVL